ncbi:MAG: hypothetical protein IPH07_04325 [Deltaproteobacteria bacterium]|nr:hypothetical protein [Deltaproteobacteria bacterium]MBK8237770.1 hypothetical protein [Deltaproteobacteria bacterium]MBK8720139.1 hypothetical protein [Deltaproteobacteria bacterium]MBP7289054.1 hypothetical protein [Nannocystaceae bacterium]
MHRNVVAIALVLGCTSTVAPAPAPAEAPPQPAVTQAASPPKGPVAAPIPLEPPDWRCARDTDCAQTCALGAVSRAWIEAHPERDTCDDGCNWQHDKVACRNGQCVTLREDGSIDEGCSHRTAPR